MAELKGNTVHFNNGATINFQRTLRLPDDGRKHHLPAGLGSFQLRNVDQLAGAPASMRAAGGVAMPMYSNEALWMRLGSENGRPVLLKPYIGGVNAISGEAVTRPNLTIDPAKQDYVVLGSNFGMGRDAEGQVGRTQPWLDGFRQSGGTSVRQFVATSNDASTAEAQVRGKVELGGMQFTAVPMRDEYYNSVYKPALDKALAAMPPPRGATRGIAGIGAGAEIEQKIYDDLITKGKSPDAIWDVKKADTFRVHLTEAAQWPKLTGGERMPHPPISEQQYQKHGIPFYKINDKDAAAVTGDSPLDGIKPVDKVPGGANPVIEVDPHKKTKPGDVKPW